MELGISGEIDSFFMSHLKNKLQVNKAQKAESNTEAFTEILTIFSPLRYQKVSQMLNTIYIPEGGQIQQY